MSGQQDGSGRLFIGIPLPTSMRKTLGQYARQIEPRLPGRYVPLENYHITLAFLGDTPFSDIPKLKDCLQRGSSAFSAFETSLSELGHFGRDQSATLWAGVTHAHHLEEIASAIRLQLDEAGFSYDRKPAKAHITLARKVNLPHELALPGLPHTKGRLDTITLFHSTRRGGALVYLPLQEVVLP